MRIEYGRARRNKFPVGASWEYFRFWTKAFSFGMNGVISSTNTYGTSEAIMEHRVYRHPQDLNLSCNILLLFDLPLLSASILLLLIVNINIVLHCNHPPLVTVCILISQVSMSSPKAYNSTEDEALSALTRSNMSINRPNCPSPFPPPHVLSPTAETHTHTIIALHGRGSNGPEVRSSASNTPIFPPSPQKATQPEL